MATHSDNVKRSRPELSGAAGPFAAACQARNAAGAEEPDWLRQIRIQGAERFLREGLPHRRLEAWKYTDLRARLRSDLPVVPAHAPGPEVAARDAFAELDAYRLVIANGRLRRDASSLPPAGSVEIAALSEGVDSLPGWARALLVKGQARSLSSVAALNACLMVDAVCVRIAAASRLDKPLHVSFVNGAGGVQVPGWLALEVEKGAVLTLVESHRSAAGEAPLFVNAVSDITLGEGAVLDHTTQYTEAPTTIHVETRHVTVAAGGAYDAFLLLQGGALTRVEAAIALAGGRARTGLYGAYMLSGKQHGDITTVIDHRVPDGTSREVVHGALAGAARGAFQGKIVVAPDAQRTDAHQLSRALLLSKKAEMDAKPELEIYADDVKCSHGATIGDLDAEAVFYLRSRGIPLNEARALLIAAFLGDVVGEVKEQPIQAALRDAIAAWLRENDEHTREES